MPDNDSAHSKAFQIGDTVKLADPQWDNVLAQVRYVFHNNQRVMLNLPLAGSTTWDVAALVLVTPARFT